MQGIGDSSQGFANAILFVIFSKNVRESFKKCVLCKKANVSVESGSGDGSKMMDPSEPTTSITDEEKDPKIQNSEQISYGTVN